METTFHRSVPVMVLALLATPVIAAEGDDLRFWLENMVWYHQYTIDEVVEATKRSRNEITDALRTFDVSRETRPTRRPGDPLLVLPYPGGRHPRIGFLEGAIDPMRGTKFSVFLPWPDAGYVVVDLPEAVWANGELIFLAHTHIATVWDKKGQPLRNIDWTRKPNGVLEETRTLPNGIVIGTRVFPRRDVVDCELWIRNGTETPLTKLRTQNCVMLKGAPDFNALTNDNKVLIDEVAAVRSKDGKRWIATVCDYGKPWANPAVPCMHSDPNFPDCGPGETVISRGRIFFYTGDSIEDEVKRLRHEQRLFWHP